MKTELADGAPGAPAEELRRELSERCRRWLVPQLRGRLRFADADAVARLVGKQLSHTRFPAGELRALLSEQPATAAAREAWLEAKAREFCAGSEAAACVEDCDRVAEYLLASTSKDRRQEIRGCYWNAYRGWVANTLLRMFRERFPLVSPEDARLQEAQAWVEDRAFDEARFGRTAAAYKAGEGKTFASFLEFLLSGRCRDARQKLGSEPGAYDLRGDSALLSLASEEPLEAENGWEEPAVEGAAGAEPGPAEPAAQRLGRCLSALPDPEERAVVELRYRAHVNPKLMASWTLGRAAQAASLAQLQAAFEADQAALRTLQEEEIPERESEQRQAFGQRERNQAELEAQGWSRERINELKHPGGVPSIERLQAEMKQPATPGTRRQELEFQIACVRRQKASNRLLEARDRLVRYQEARHPWVRSQEEIARILGMDQVTVGRRLKSALLAMREWLLNESPRARVESDDG